MTRHDHDRLTRCRKVLSEMLNDGKKKPLWRVQRLKDDIAVLDDKLKEPIVEIENTGEHLKVENPFV